MSLKFSLVVDRKSIVELSGIIPALRQELELDGSLAEMFAYANTISNRGNLLEFFSDRLRVHLREEGARFDLIDAVYNQGCDDLLMIVHRVEALGRFLETEDGATLLMLVRRAINILRIEEKKDAKSYDGAPAAKLFKEKEERSA